MAFPRLTGLRNDAIPLDSPTQISSTRSLDAGDVLHHSPIQRSRIPRAVEAAWSRLLLEYSDADPQEGVVFGNLDLNHAWEEKERASLDSFGLVALRVTPHNKEGALQSNADVISGLCDRRPVAGAPHFDTAIFHQQLRDGDATEASLELCGSIMRESGLSVVLASTLDCWGLSRFRILFTSMHLDESAAWYVLDAFHDILRWTVGNGSQSFIGASLPVRGELLSKLSASDNTVATKEPPGLLHSRFELIARERSHETALVFASNLEDSSPANTIWTYNELNERATVVFRNLLRSPGIHKTSVVPIVSERCPELYVAVLGILKAGKAWCPIDTLSPPSRRQDLIARTGSPLVLTTAAVGDDARLGIPDGLEVICVDETSVPQAQDNDDLQIVDTRTEDMAYLIWTSGTTGPPKGVSVSHGAAAAAMRSLHATIPTSRRDEVRCVQFSQYTFDVFVQDLFFTWGLGGTLISATRELMVGSFAQLVTKFEATHAHLTPAFAARLPRQKCPTLEVVTMIGEALPQNVADDWGRNIRAFNTYGPAEAAVVSTIEEFSGLGARFKSINIGLPLPTVQCYVLRQGFPALVGSIGELALAGPQLADGYIRDPDKTAAKFTREKSSGCRVYMTGDLVRQLPNGSLEFVGRKDDLVKVNGIRIELSEISFAAQNCHPLVDHIETFHLSRADRPTKALVCFLASDQLGKTQEADNGLTLLTAEAAEIARAARLHFRTSLPEHMTPQTIIVIGCMPRTPSAKIDRKALQSTYEGLDIEQWKSVVEGVDHKTAAHRTSSRISHALEVISSFCHVSAEQLQDSTSLASLGIDSLATLLLSGKLKELGLDVGPQELASCRTLGDFLRMVDQIDDAEPKRQRARFDLQAFHDRWHHLLVGHFAAPEFLVAPALPLQESLLAETLVNPRAYWSNHVYELPRETDISLLQGCWARTAQRIEALRTTFIATAELATQESSPDSSFLQVIHAKPELDWTRCDLRSDADLEATARDSALAVTDRHSKDPFKRPPWAVAVMQTRERLYLLLTIHHVLHDQDSIEHVVDTVRAEYDGVARASTKTPQLRDAVSVLLSPTDAGSQHLAIFPSKSLEGFEDPEAASWPDLTGRRDPHQVRNPRALLSHVRQLSTPKASVHRAAQTYDVSPISILRAAWGLIIMSYLDAQHCVLGEVRSQRLRYPELAGAVAPLIGVFPVPFVRNASVSSFLASHQQWIVRTSQRNSPSAAVVRSAIKKPRHLPLYDSIFVFQNGVEDRDLGADLRGNWRPLPDPVGLFVEHPTAFNLYEARDYYSLEVLVQRSLFNQSQAELLALQMDYLVKALVTRIDRPLIDLKNSLPKAVISRSQSCLPASRDHQSLTCPTSWIEKWALEQPGWIAVEVAQEISDQEVSTESWTFQRLYEHSRGIAACLKRHGLSKKVVALCSGRSLTSYAAILGIFLSDNIYLPIDENLPDERKRLLLTDSRCSALLSDEECAAYFGELPSNCFNLDIATVAQEAKEIRFGDTNCLVPPNPDSSAYLLYTSGSTGKPKGVLISHRNLCNFVEGLAGSIEKWHPPAAALGGSGKFLGLASRAFDVHLCEMFLAWRLGLRAVTAPREVLLADLQTSLKVLKVTHACFVPSLLDQSGLEPQQVPDLTYFSVGGEKVTPKTLDTWSSQTSTLVVNAYGPTELAIGCCASRIYPSSNARNIGGPYGNTTVHVLSPRTCDYVLRGEPGELCFTGDLVGIGYHERPDAQGFVEDFQGQRMYRTGDMGRMMADGSIEYLGRGDDQTKIRGQRIELGEVNETIRSLTPDRVDAATLLLKHPNLPRAHLVSFASPSTKRSARYAAAPDLQVDRSTWARRMHDDCKQQLPAYMVPEFLLPVSVIPLASISGKADTKALEELYKRLPLEVLVGAKGPARRSSNESRSLSPTERMVRDAIHESIFINGYVITPATNVFEIGFDSLRIISLCMRLQKVGFKLHVPTILSHPSVHQLAMFYRPDVASEDSIGHEKQRQLKKLEELESTLRQELTDYGVTTDHVESIRPCLPLQEAMVAMSLGSPDSNLYVNRTTLRLGEQLDVGRLQRAIIEWACKTPILRTCFQTHSRGVCQLIHWLKSHPVRAADVPLLKDSSSSNGFEDWQTETCRQLVKHIDQRSPWRVCLRRSTSGSYFCELFIHHALYDGTSLRMLLNDLYDYYSQSAPSHRPNLDAMLGFHVCQDKQKQQEFWTGYLSGFQSTVLPSTDIEDFMGPLGQIDEYLGVSLSDLRQVAARHKCTSSTLLQFVFAIALSRILQQDDVTFGAVLSGRTVPVDDVDRIAGPCITTIPRRLCIPKIGMGLTDMFNTFTSSLATCLEHQFTSLRDIKRWLQIEGHVFNCLFSYIPPSEPPKFEGYWTELESLMAPDYPLAFEFEPMESTDSVACRAVLWDSGPLRQIARSLLDDINTLVGALNRDEEIQTFPSSGSERKQSDSAVETQPNWNDNIWTTGENVVKETVSEMFTMKADQITKNVGFFRLGIDSISAIQFASRLRRKGLKVQASDIMKHPCIGALWHHLRFQEDSKALKEPRALDSRKSAVSTDETHISKAIIEYPCTPLQTGMIATTLSSSGDAYIHHHVLRLRPDAKLDLLQQAWDHATEFHDVLRTSFRATAVYESDWYGVVHPEIASTWMEAADDAPVEQVLSHLRSEMAVKSAEDLNAPPIRATAVRGKLFNHLIISMHHALYDGISIQLLLDDIVESYCERRVPNSTPFHAIARAMAKDQAAATKFWADTLKGYRAAPDDDPQHPGKTSRHIEHTLTCPTGRISQGARDLNVTVQAVVLLAYTKILCSVLNRRDVVFGLVLSGRSLPFEGIEKVVGPVFNTVPFRAKLKDLSESNGDAARRCQEAVSSCQEHQVASLRTIQDLWRQETGGPRSRLFNSLLLFQKSDDATAAEDVLWDIEDIAEGPAPEYPLNTEIEQAKDSISIRMTASPGFLPQAGLEELVAQFEECLRDVVNCPSRNVLAFPPKLSSTPLEASQGSLVTQAPKRETLNQQELGKLRSIISDFCDVDIEELSAESNIFHLGVDSISAIKMVTRCRDGGLKLTVANVLQGETLQGILERKNESTPYLNGVSGVNTVAGNLLSALPYWLSESKVERVYPCLGGQMYHLASQVADGHHATQPTFAYDTIEKLDLLRLQAALESLVERHEILRTMFAAGGPRQAIQAVLRPSDPRIPTLWRHGTRPIDACTRQHSQIRFDHFTTPWRIGVVEETSSDCILLTLHHSLYDAWNIPLLVSELASLYQGQKLEATPPFSDFVRSTVTSLKSQEEGTFWQHALRDKEISLITQERSLSRNRGYKSTAVFTSIHAFEGHVLQLENICKECGFSAPNIILLAFGRLVARLTGARNPTFGHYHAARSASFPSADRVVGPLLNVLPVVVPSALQRPVSESVAALRSELAARIPHEQSSLASILDCIGAADAPLFNLYINILWHQPDVGGATEATLLRPRRIDLPLTGSEPDQSLLSTAIDGLAWPISAEGIWFDVAREGDSDRVQIAAKCVGGLTDERELRGLLAELLDEIQTTMDEL